MSMLEVFSDFRFWIGVALGIVVVASLTVWVQHEKIREKVLIRARALFEQKELLEVVDEELEDMPIPMMRDLCALPDEKFRAQVMAWLKK